MNRKLKIKSAILQSTALLLFFALAFGTTAASTGLIGNPGEVTEEGEKSPFEQLFSPPTENAETTTPPITSENGKEPVPPTDENTPSASTDWVTNLNNAFNTGLIEGYTDDRSKISLSQRVELHNRLTASIGTATNAMTPVTYQSYSSDAYMLAKRVTMEKDFIAGTEIITKYSKEYSNSDASYTTVATPYLIGRKTVQPYMGYLILSRVEERQVEIPATETEPTVEPSSASAENNGEVRYETVEVTVLSLYDRNGKLLVDDLGTKKPYFARDYSNYPVFVDEDEKLYSFNGKSFKQIGKNSLRSNLFYDYPAYPVGVFRNMEAYYSTSAKSYKFVNASTKYTAISADYHLAFNFASNGIAVVVTATGNELRVINRSKSRVFKPGSQYTFYVDPQTGKKQYAKDYYYVPDTLGIESIGCAGFDSGYLRLRIRTLSMMNDSKGKVVQDVHVLVNAKGEQFPIPEGYTIAGYSEGIILLEKDGLYGYYSVQGKWITQPIYTYARPFIQGLAVLGSEDGTMGMIDKNGNIVLPFVFSSVSDVSSGVIVTYCEGIGWETYELVKKS